MNSLSPELTLEKLQLIATAKASSASKIKWLGYFNSLASTREARRLPPKSINEERLITFLSKLCWWAGVRHHTQFINSDISIVHLSSIRVPISNFSTYIASNRVQIAEQASITFDDILRQDRIPIDMESPLEPMTLSAYIEDCRMKLWDHAFASIFRGRDAFKKSDDFVSFKGTDLVVRRVLFRYLCSCLFPSCDFFDYSDL